jgi:4-amino-4-deoxy-L-arabinose transferase-like glycosyltransferase
MPLGLAFLDKLLATHLPPEPAETASKRRFALVLLLPFVLAGCLFFTRLASLPLLEPDEGRNAEVAREMLVSGDWITPHYNSFPYLDKPAVFFWMVASSFKVAGVSEWSARLPSALMGLCLLLLSSFLARRMFGDAAALRAGVIVATAPLVMAFSRLVIFDITLAFFITLAMFCYWFAEATEFRHPAPDLLMFLAMGLATITKGPVGLLVPLLSITVYQAVRGKLGELKRLRWGLGCAVFLAAALPWFISISIRYPDFPRYVLIKESLERFYGGLAHRGGGPFYYLPVYLAGFFPWSIFLLLAAWNRHRQWKEIRTDRNRPILFLVTWSVVTFVFFSLSQSKLPGYFLPAVVPLGILMAKAWEEVSSHVSKRSPDWLTAGFACLLGAGLIIAASSQLALFSSAHSHLVKRIHPAVFALLKPSLLYTGLILAALAMVGRNVSSRMRGASLSVAAFVFLALTGPMLLVRWIIPLKAYAETNSSRQLAEAIRSGPEKDLPIYGYYYFRTSLPFYLERPVGLVTSGGSESTSNYLVSQVQEMRSSAEAGSKALPRTFKGIDPAPPDRRLLLDVLELIDLARSSPEPRLIVVRNTHVNMLAKDVGRIEPLWTGWDYSVWEIPGKSPAPSQDVPPRVVNPLTP